MIFTEEDQTKYWSEKSCNVCKGEFIQGEQIIVKLEDVTTREKSKSAHSICNLRYKENSFNLVMITTHQLMIIT